MKIPATLPPLLAAAAFLNTSAAFAQAPPAAAPPAATAPAADPFALGPDSKPQEGIPKGEVLHFTFTSSKVFPGSVQDYQIYIPAQYSPDKPACLYVNQDGQQWTAHTVFDNLIARGEMPVTIGVFITPGKVKATDEKTALDRFNRSYEYDGLGDNYARFLIEELLPEVETKKTSDGRAIHFSHDGKDRAIGGSSSGAIAAFTAAWERPDSFSRVFSVIGTYVGLRGGEVYPTLIRKTEPKPLRVFLEDGSNDLNIYGGDWFFANQMMERALTFSGYEVNHVYGTHGHDGRQGAANFPDVMRWLWKGWPDPVKTGETKNEYLKTLLIPGEAWQLNPNAFSFSTAGGSVTSLQKEAGFLSLYNGRTFRVSGDSRIEVGTGNHDYRKVAEGDQRKIGGLTVSPDQTLLYVSDAASHWVWSYQIQPDGALRYGQKYYWLHSPDDADDAGAGEMCVDADGRLYVATRMGVQIADQAGRVECILPLPGNRAVKKVRFFGQDPGMLVATCADGTIYTRRLHTTRVLSHTEPIKPAAPHL